MIKVINKTVGSVAQSKTLNQDFKDLSCCFSWLEDFTSVTQLHRNGRKLKGSSARIQINDAPLPVGGSRSQTVQFISVAKQNKAKIYCVSV